MAYERVPKRKKENNQPEVAVVAAARDGSGGSQ